MAGKPKLFSQIALGRKHINLLRCYCMYQEAHEVLKLFSTEQILPVALK